MKDKTKKIIDSKSIKDLAKLLEELSLTEISYRDGDFSVMVARGARVQTINSDKQIQDNEGDSIDENDYKNDPKAIKSPMVGTVYLQP